MKKILFVPFEACLDDNFNPVGPRFVKAKARIEFAFANRWQVYLFKSAEWGQMSPWPNPETNRYTLAKNRWGIGSRGPNESIRDLADRMAALQPANHPVMRGLFCPNQRSDLPTECYQIRFNYRRSMSNVHYSIQPQWAAMAADPAGNNSFRLPSGGMMKTILKFFKDQDHRIAAVWHQEGDRVSANMIGAPLYSSQEWLSGVDPYERSIVVKNKSVSVWSWEYPDRESKNTNDGHWKTNQRPSLYG